MPRLQNIVRRVDALGGQQRYILWLECGHKASLSAMTFAACPSMIQQVQTAAQWLCPFCPDPPPPEKSVRQIRMHNEYDSLGD
jgi:hypothetical protein